MNVPTEFDSIRPFEPEELPAVYERLLSDPQFRTVVGYIFPDIPFEALAEKMRKCKTNLEFQLAFCYGFLEKLLEKASKGCDIDTSAVDTSRRYTFVSNHRDIVLDSALLDKLLVDAGFKTTCEIAIGDNLLAAPWIKDLVRINKSFIVERRKTLYKAIIYLEDIVTGAIDISYSEIEEKVAEISNIPVEKRYYLVRKLGLAINLLINAFGENTKWRWSFTELQGRFAAVAKNLIDMKKASKDYFDPNSSDYDNTVLYIRLVKKLLFQSATGYRDRYELSTHRIDDMRLAIGYLSAQRRVELIMGNADEGEEIKKKAVVWHDKLLGDQKSGLAK